MALMKVTISIFPPQDNWLTPNEECQIMKKGGGAIIMWCNILPEFWDDFVAWHTQEHMFERVGIPGLRRGSRWRSTSRPNGILVFYDLDDVSVFFGKDYLKRLNDPTPWTKRVMPGVRDMMRTPSRSTATAGAGVGSNLLTLSFKPRAGFEGRLRDWVAAKLVPTLMAQGALGVKLFEAETSQSRPITAEHNLRKDEDRIADWSLLIYGQEACRDDFRDLLSETELVEAGAAPDFTTESYVLSHSLSEHEI
jgi:hypothetical protein